MYRLNPKMPTAAQADAFWKMLRIEGPTLVQTSRWFQRMLVEGAASARVPEMCR
jgi:hypothetical protein